MAQQLIVEGNDAIAIANLLKKRNLPPPEGYFEPKKFENEFVKRAGGVDKITKIVNEALRNPSLSNIGIILDANDVGAKNRWESLKSLLIDKLEESALETIQNYGTGKVS